MKQGRGPILHEDAVGNQASTLEKSSWQSVFNIGEILSQSGFNIEEGRLAINLSLFQS